MDEAEDIERQIDFLTNSMKLAAKLGKALRTKDGYLLELIKFKKLGEGYYYSLSDKSHVLVNRGEEWYYCIFKERVGRGKRGGCCREATRSARDGASCSRSGGCRNSGGE